MAPLASLGAASSPDNAGTKRATAAIGGGSKYGSAQLGGRFTGMASSRSTDRRSTVAIMNSGGEEPKIMSAEDRKRAILRKTRSRGTFAVIIKKADQSKTASTFLDKKKMAAAA